MTSRKATGGAPGTGERSEPVLDAGPFGSWLDGLQRSLQDESPAEVPCGTCTACCTSAQFILIRPDETETLAHIPPALRFPAPGLPAGHVVLGYDERGHCPMLRDGVCTIYEHRPRTCRTYDCRVFPATGIDVGEQDKPLIARQSRRWQFSFATEYDRRQHAAVEAAAAFLRDHGPQLPAGVVPANPTQLAAAAIGIADLFLAAGDPPSPDQVAAALVGRRR